MEDETLTAPRFSLKLPMRYRRKGEIMWRNTKTVSVSSSGAVFVAPEILQPDCELELAISMRHEQDKARMILTTSVVVRQSSGTEGLTTVVRHLTYRMVSDPLFGTSKLTTAKV
jgi:hypothetical protein